ncbi:hypothetical protein PVK06_048460 [Gossypium arboreum]|uniref:Uncharacterized protein n=1 Tax=Gossypium arboreum TaxID=29729 RepID=A0ABR0MFY7_GOSAR|nr:hypothetical protein PVK06_048460 [Gossypium arboreum]
MVVDSIPAQEISWRDKVLGRGAPDSSRDEDFEFLDGNVVRTTVNGVPPINFSERSQRIPFPPTGANEFPSQIRRPRWLLNYLAGIFLTLFCIIGTTVSRSLHNRFT